MPDNLSTLSETAKQYYERKLLMRALPLLAVYKAGLKNSVPKSSGNQVSWRRMNALATATTALSEGVTPTSASLDMTEVTGTVAQYGNFVTVSDALDLMGIDPIIAEATDVIGENAGQSVEQIIRTEVVTGTSVIYATGSARNAQSSSNPLTLTMVRKGVRQLEVNDAKPFFSDKDENGIGGVYLGWIHPRAYYDLFGDTTLQNTFIYSDPDKIYTMKLPVAGGVAWIKSTYAPVFAGAGSGAADVYGTMIFGKEAFGVVDVAGTGKFKTIVKQLGSGGTEDPLEQRATIGWKSFQLPKILNNNFMVRLEAGVSA